MKKSKNYIRTMDFYRKCYIVNSRNEVAQGRDPG